MWPNWFHSFRKPNTNKKRKSKRTTNRLKGTEHLEDRSLLATISGYVWDDLNANGIRDTTQISFQGNPPIVVMMVDVSFTAEDPFFTNPLPGSNVGDVNGDGTSNSNLDNQIYAYIQLNRKLIANGFGQTGRVILIGYGENAAAVDFARDDFPDIRDLDTFNQLTRFVVNPSFDSTNDGIPDIEQMLVKFRQGFVPQNGSVGNPVDNTTSQVPGGFDPKDPATPNFGSPNFIDVGPDNLNYTNAHALAVSLLQTEQIVPVASGISIPALPQFANRITIINFATQGFEDIDYADPTAVDGVPVQRALGVQYYAFGLGAFPSLVQLRLISPTGRILRNFAELDGFVAGSRFTEPGIAQAQVYIDANNNARYDVGETIVTTSADAAGTAIDESGNFAFTGLAAGTYIVRQLLPLNFTQTFPSAAFYRVVISSATQVVTNINFSRSANNTFRGFVFNDANDDGVFTFGERGLANVRVYIDVNKNGRRDSNEPTAVTIRDIASTTNINEAGQYSFVNVAPGTYIVRAEAPVGFIISSPTASTFAPLGATILPGGLAWQITLPATTANGTRISTINGINFSAVQGPRAPLLTTSSGIAIYTEGQLASVHTFVDPKIVIDLRGNPATGVQLVTSIIQNGDFGDILRPFNGGGIAFKPLFTDPNEPFPSWEIRANGVVIGTAEGGRDSTPLVMTFNNRANQALIQAAARRIEFLNKDPNLSNLDRAIGFQLILPAGQESNLPVKFIRVTTINNAPILGPSTPDQFIYNAGTGPIQVFNGVTVTDTDNPANYGGGRINVTLGGQSVGLGDLLTLEEVPGLLEFVDNGDGKDVYFFDGVDFWLVGRVTAFVEGSALEISLTARATPAIVELLISQIRYEASDLIARPAGTTTISLTLVENQINGTSNTVDVIIDVQGAPIAALAFALMESQSSNKKR
jgi:hypothetical protein